MKINGATKINEKNGSSVSESYENESSKKSIYDNTQNIEAYRLTVENVAQEFTTNIINGLSTHDAAKRLQTYGPNNLGKEESISYVKILAHQVFNAMILVLIISMIIALAIKDWISGGVIAGVILINVVIGFVQELKAEKLWDH